MSGVKARHGCARPMCPGTTLAKYCEECAPQFEQADAEAKVEHERRYDKARGSATKRGYDKKWSDFSERYRKHPDHALCVDCRAEKHLEPTTQVHHLIPPEVRPDLKYAAENLVPLCLAHHNKRHGKRGGR